VKLGDYRERPAEPFNEHEPVDSSAAAIGAQGLLRLGRYLGIEGEQGTPYWQAGLTSLKHPARRHLPEPRRKPPGALPALGLSPPERMGSHPRGQKVPCGESSMWGDYHVRELALFAQRHAESQDYTFFGCVQ
jgi:unsaturated chondroitin disaccharide hydrolase